MGKSQREKGKRGERMFRDVLRDAGFDSAYRTQQFSGACPEGSADVRCPQLPSLHFEVKNNHGFLVTLPAEEFLDILRRSDLVVQPEPKSLKLESEEVVA